MLPSLDLAIFLNTKYWNDFIITCQKIAKTEKTLNLKNNRNSKVFMNVFYYTILIEKCATRTAFPPKILWIITQWSIIL